MAREKKDFRGNLIQIATEIAADVVDGNLNVIAKAFPNDPGAMIPLKAASEYLGISERTLKGLQDFPVKKIGGRYFVSRVALARWMS